MTPHQIFQQMSPELAAAVTGYLQQDERAAWRAAVGSLAGQRRLRPVFIQRKSGPQQLAWMLENLKRRDCDALAEQVLQVWLLKAKKQMLIDFLDTLGIEHDGEGSVNDIPEELDADKTKEAVGALCEKHPAEEVAVYLHMFQLQRADGWPELAAAIEADERVKLGA